MPVEVTAHARLHCGFLDLTGEGARRFGGIGLSIDEPVVRVRLEACDRLIVGRVDGAVEGAADGMPDGAAIGGTDGDDEAGAVAAMVRRLAQLNGLPARGRIDVMSRIPRHVGLGSGTQLAMAVGRGLATLHGVALEPAEIAAATLRARRSGIGYHTFQQGGFVVDGGHRPPESARRCAPPPLLARHPVPDAWRIILAIPQSARTVSGETEEEAFRRLRPAPQRSAEELSRLILMRLLPALVEADLPEFGAALAEVQEIVGASFAGAQRGPYHADAAGLVRALREAGGHGVGQSSWGPAVYAFSADDAAVDRLRDAAQRADAHAWIAVARGWNRGASCVVLDAARATQKAPPR